jgi:hypothetical protein
LREQAQHIARNVIRVEIRQLDLPRDAGRLVL